MDYLADHQMIASLVSGINKIAVHNSVLLTHLHLDRTVTITVSPNALPISQSCLQIPLFFRPATRTQALACNDFLNVRRVLIFDC